MAINLEGTLARERLIRESGLFEGARVGHLGCGSSGYFTLGFAHAVGMTGHVYAVDILPSALEAVQRAVKAENVTNVETIWSNLELQGGTKIPQRTLDFVYLITVLFQNKNYPALITEAVRLLRSGGKLVVVEWLPGKGVFGPPENQRLSDSAVTAAAEAAGLKKQQSYEMGEYYYFAEFIR